MSFSYSGDPSSSKLDECRFLLGDINAASPIMQDEEINYIISQFGSSEASLMYHLFAQAATFFARDIKRTLGPQSEDPTSRLSYFKEQAELYRRRMQASGISVPVYAHCKVFSKGMHSNPPNRRRV
jgi:hypothetical protein